MKDISKSIAVIKLLKQIMASIKNAHKPCDEMNLTGPQAMLVGSIAHHGEMKISELSEKMGLSNSTVSGIVDRLEKQGIVERIRSKDDRRVVWVNLTSEHRACIKNKFKDLESRFEEVMGRATEEEVKKIFEGLETLKMLIEKSNNK